MTTNQFLSVLSQSHSLNWGGNLQVKGNFTKHTLSVIIKTGRQIQQVDLPGEVEIREVIKLPILGHVFAPVLRMTH